MLFFSISVYKVLGLYTKWKKKSKREGKGKQSSNLHYQMYSAIILSVYGLVSKFSKSSSLDTTPVFSVFAASTLKGLPAFLGLGPGGGTHREFHNLVLTVRLELHPIPFGHCKDGANVWAILGGASIPPFYLSSNLHENLKSL
jgi:hypothetical protein